VAYYDNVNTTLLELVSPSARRILEVGCGAGALARAVKTRLPSVHYSGIELIEEQLGLAADVLDFGLVRNLDQMGEWSQDVELNQAIPPGSMDHVIFGDVLEHLYDPQAALTQAATRLAPNGSALVCIPNVQHWSVFVQLVSGSWPQTDAGLFDKTHIRWFTLTDMIRLVEAAGLTVERIEERIFAPEVGLPFLEDLEALAHTVGVDPNLVIQRGLPLQYVLVGRKSLPPS
jgi:SAM-dependent methyltransferase